MGNRDGTTSDLVKRILHRSKGVENEISRLECLRGRHKLLLGNCYDCSPCCFSCEDAAPGIFYDNAFRRSRVEPFHYLEIHIGCRFTVADLIAGKNL